MVETEMEASLSFFTARLRLVPSTLELARLERTDRAAFTARLEAAVPDNWPPGILADALDFFDQLLTEHPDWSGWLGWYAIAAEEAALVGSVGFKGPPDESGLVEIGYSVLPQYQRRGYAVEMGRGLIDWAFHQPSVAAILAEAADSNHASRAVLKKLGFKLAGPVEGQGSHLYRLEPDRSTITRNSHRRI